MAQPRQSDRIREIVAERYVRPAVLAGDSRFAIRVKDVLKDAEAAPEFPRGRTPLICEVLQGKKLLNEHGLEIERVEGPPSKQSPTVVVHYRVRHQAPGDAGASKLAEPSPIQEDSAAWAERLTGRLRGLLKEEITVYGGAEAFMKWVRSDDEDAA